jgi:3-oxoacyl-[acyl-carrier protein] reductase
MTDRYANFAHSGAGKFFVRRLGLPDPPKLRRHHPDKPLIDGQVIINGAGRLVEPVRKLLEKLGAPLEGPTGALVFDATAIVDTDGLRALYDFFHPLIRTLRPSGRVVVLGSPPELCADAREATAQRALEGFVRSVGKEIGRGGTAQLVYVAPGAEEAIESSADGVT